MPNHPLLLNKPVKNFQSGRLLSSDNFWDIPRNISGFSFAYCIAKRDLVIEAIDKVLASGVQEYHVGSRGLKRLSLKDLQDMLTFWTNAANDAALGFSSAIQSRRAKPCDV